MEGCIPEKCCELTAYNLDCEVPLSFHLLPPKNESGILKTYKITINKIENSPHFVLEDKYRVQRLTGVHPVKLITIVHPKIDYDSIIDEAGIKELKQVFSEFTEEQLRKNCIAGVEEDVDDYIRETANSFLIALRLLKSRRIWMSHIHTFLYSDFFPTHHPSLFGGIPVYIPLKPYILENKNPELIEKIILKTLDLHESAMSSAKGIKRNIMQCKIENKTYPLHLCPPRDCIEKTHLYRALSYYMRAHDEYFYRGDVSFLLLFIAMEVLFTTQTDQVKSRLSNRVAMLLGENAEQRKDIRKRMEELYKFRSEIVHGSHDVKLEIIEKLLEDLFEYTRLAILYFLAVSKRKRKDVINTLDNRGDIEMLREEIKKFYSPKLHTVLQFQR